MGRLRNVFWASICAPLMILVFVLWIGSMWVGMVRMLWEVLVVKPWKEKENL
jgi:hypothetical protein